MNSVSKLRWIAGVGSCALALLMVGKAAGEWGPPPPPPDADGDGMLDSWEIQYFGNLAQTGAGDFDGDGVSNLEEFQLGRNPTVGAVADTTGATGFVVYTPLK